MSGSVRSLGVSSQPSLSIILRAEPEPRVVPPAETMVRASLGGRVSWLLAEAECGVQDCQRKLRVTSRTPHTSALSGVGEGPGPSPLAWPHGAPCGNQSRAIEHDLCAGHRCEDSEACLNSLEPWSSPFSSSFYRWGN